MQPSSLSFVSQYSCLAGFKRSLNYFLAIKVVRNITHIRSEIEISMDTQVVHFQSQITETQIHTSSIVSSAETPSTLSPYVQNSGSKIFGPPDDWIGTPPDSSCELYIRRIPKNVGEHKLMEPFFRFGKVYQFRIPFDFHGIRGYAYVRYTNEEDAGCAMEVLNHLFIEPMKTLDIVNSCEKCRLFVSNIPKHLKEGEIEQKLKAVFPAMQRIYTKGSLKDNEGNTGYIFVNFATHNEALEAKKSCAPGVIHLWGQDLKVVWANTEGAETSASNTTLFVRNVDLRLNNRDLVDLMVQFVPRTTIRKISKVRTNAFVDFTCRQAAETVLQRMQGVVLGGCRFVVEWAKPSAQQSLHRMRNIDFDSLLRLKCIANQWYIPVVIFGLFFKAEGIQYAAVLLRNAECPLRFIIVALQCRELIDIHSRLCEVAVTLIDKIGGFPDCNYVLSAQKDIAHLFGAVDPGTQMQFVASYGVPHEAVLDLNEIIDLSWACAILSNFSEQQLLQKYRSSFYVNEEYTYLNDWNFGQRKLGTIMPKYRNKPHLKYNLNDTQVVLALCFQATGSNSTFIGRDYAPLEVAKFDVGHIGLPYMKLPLLPLSLTQSRFATNHVLSHVPFGGTKYYHPSQQIMTPPLWVAGTSYSECLRQQVNVTNHPVRKMTEIE